MSLNSHFFPCEEFWSNAFYDWMPFLATTTCMGGSIKMVLNLTFKAKIQPIQLHNVYAQLLHKTPKMNYIVNCPLRFSRVLRHTWVKTVMLFYSYITRYIYCSSIHPLLHSLTMSFFGSPTDLLPSTLYSIHFFTQFSALSSSHVHLGLPLLL